MQRTQVFRLKSAVILASLVVSSGASAQEIGANLSRADAEMLAAEAKSQPRVAPLHQPAAIHLAVAQPLTRSSAFALGLQKASADQRTVDMHEVDSAFSSQSQSQGGMAGARLSFHF